MFLLSFLALALVSTILADTQTKPANKKCEICSTDYEPICAAPAGSKDEKDTISFGSTCVMNKYNCENNKSKINKKLYLWIDDDSGILIFFCFCFLLQTMQKRPMVNVRVNVQFVFNKRAKLAIYDEFGIFNRSYLQCGTLDIKTK